MPEHSHTYKQLENFIRDEMRMSHIYQPVMLIKLLESSGKAKITDIAKSLLSHDQSQIEYCEDDLPNYRPADLVAEMRLGRRLRIKVPRKTGHAQKIDVSSSKPRRVAGLEMPGVAWACLIRNANRAIIRD